MVRVELHIVRTYFTSSIPLRQKAVKILNEELVQEIPAISPSPNPPTFLQKDGFQYVAPYTKLTYFTIDKLKSKNTYTVLEYLQKNFIGRNVDFFKKQIEEGKLWVERPIPMRVCAKTNGLKISKKAHKSLKKNSVVEFVTIKGEDLKDFKLKKSDIIANYACIHELKIPHIESFDIIHESKDLLVVNKPSGIPVHPSGMSYRFNTLQFLLSKKRCSPGKSLYNPETLEIFPSLWPCHRIDKETSGIVIFAKNKVKCGEISKLIETKENITKRYLIHVHGKFGNEVKTCEDPIVDVDVCKKYENGGVSRIQHAKSTFKFVYYDAKTDTSILLGEIFTGRKHQIRQHLRNEGFHIVNDPLYGVMGILKDKMTGLPNRDQFNALRGEYIKKMEERMSKFKKESRCLNCNHINYFDDNFRADSYMHLHAWEYTYTSEETPKLSWSFITSPPSWITNIVPPNLLESLGNRRC